MKYDVYFTRNVKQFIQVTVEASTRELAETFAVVEAQNAPEEKWEIDTALMVNVEDMRIARHA